jgi:hypothetical protein
MLDENNSLLQQFLTYQHAYGPIIIEVGITPDQRLLCNCFSFSASKGCKHSRFVKHRMEGNNGVYDNGVSIRATKEDRDKAKLSSKNRREFVAKFGTIEVF